MSVNAKDVIIACDFASQPETLEFLDKFKDHKPFVKIGMELFYATGAEMVRELKRRGHKVFLDLKLHDIPNTVKKAMKVLSNLDVDMVNVHASGTINMMSAALEGLTRADGSRPMLIAVTQLTSTSQETMKKDLLIDTPIEQTIIHYARNAEMAGLDGVVCSPLEAGLVKEACGNGFITVTPGVRFADGSVDDQKRVTTPAKARELGSDYIVMGRPITQAEDPVAAYERACKEFIGAVHKTEEKNLMNDMAQNVAEGLLKIKAVFLRPDEPFTWASGIKSPIYCDNRLILTAPEVRNMVESYIAATVKANYPDVEVLMGTSTAGIAHAAFAAGILNLPMGYVRGSAKDHGRNNRIEGKLMPGQKVVVIEDLISTGGSCIEVVDALREAGAEVLGIVSIFTYGMKKGIERLADANVKNVSLSNFDTLIEVAADNGYVKSSDIAKLKKFMSNPSDPSWMDL